MRVIVCGSRDWQSYDAVLERLVKLPRSAVIVHGNARGADTLADMVAEELGMAVERHPAVWKKHGKRAGFIRNEEMAKLGADLCIAFRQKPDSRGTNDMRARAEKHGIPVELIEPTWYTEYVLGTHTRQGL